MEEADSYGWDVGPPVVCMAGGEHGAETWYTYVQHHHASEERAAYFIVTSRIETHDGHGPVVASGLVLYFVLLFRGVLLCKLILIKEINYPTAILWTLYATVRFLKVDFL